MASVNKVILIGNLGRDPEIRLSQNGGKIATLNIATTEFRKDSKTGATNEQTEWHRISLFGKLADIAEQYLKKGSSVFIEGRIRSNKWTDKAGIERHGIEIVCESMQMLGGRSQVVQHESKAVAASFSGGANNGSGSPSTYYPPEFDDDTIPF